MERDGIKMERDGTKTGKQSFANVAQFKYLATTVRD
jgi:hypothetical protein